MKILLSHLRHVLVTLTVWLVPSHSAISQTIPSLAPNSFAYVLQADALAPNKSTAIQRLAASKRDWIVLDANFSSDTAWTRSDLNAIRRAQSGRKVFCYLSIGEAEDYRFYWHADWVNNGEPTTAAPPWLLTENPDWPGNYKVKYWDAGWQNIMLPAVDAAMARGFDGVYLDIVDAFEFFEQDGSEFIDDRVNPDTGRSYRRDMVNWVKRIAARARKSNPAALVIPQNGPQLLMQADYLSAINAIGIEDLFTDGTNRRPPSEINYSLGFLNNMTKKKKPVLLVEYARTVNQRNLVKKSARQRGFVWLLTDRDLTTLGVSGK